MAKFKAAIFDLDGTLWDASRASATAWTQTGKANGAPGHPSREITVADIRSVSGLPFVECVQRLFAGQATEELVIQLDHLERENIQAGEWQLYPGVREVLTRLSAVMPLFLVSNCQGWYLEVFLRDSGLRNLFTESVCHGETGVSKAQMLAGLTAKHDLKSAIYLGDTNWDQVAAYEARLSFGFANWGFGRPQVSCPQFNTINEFQDYVLSPRPSDVEVEILRPTERQEAQNFYRRVGYQTEITTSARVVVARAQGKIVGVVRLESEFGKLVLRGMQVAPDFQAGGVGLRMIQTLEKLITEPCFCMPHAWPEDFYGRIGFKKIISKAEAPALLVVRLAENHTRHPHLILMKRESQSVTAFG